MPNDRIKINRAPVLTLWAAVVAERLGFDHDEALSLAKAVSGMTAQTKGRRLGIFQPPPDESGKARERKRGGECWVELCGRSIPTIKTPQGVRGVVLDKPVEPATVERYLASKFGDDLPRVREAMAKLAKSILPENLGAEAFSLYEGFRPSVSEGTAGWGAKGELDLGKIAALTPK